MQGEHFDYSQAHSLAYPHAPFQAYGLKLRSADTGEISYSIKLRGITLDGDAARSIHFDSFRDQVLSYYRWQPGEPPVEPLQVNTTRFKLKKGKIFTCPFNKIYTAIFKKGIVLRNSLDIVPFGFELPEE